MLVQTLQYLFDVRAAMTTPFRVHKPGGILLLTVLSIRSQFDGRAWYWWFTLVGFCRVLSEFFRPDAASVDVYGSLFVVTVFHFRIVVDELKPSDLSILEIEFPVVVLARAIRR